MKYAFVHSELFIVRTIKDIDVPPDNPYCILLEENEECFSGYTYRAGQTPRFVPSNPVYSWTAYQFLLRFTPEERAAFRNAAITDVNVADFQQLAQAAQEVISNDPMTLAGMNYLVSIGLLSEPRKNEILGI